MTYFKRSRALTVFFLLPLIALNSVASGTRPTQALGAPENGGHNSIGAPLNVAATLSSAPVVGQDITWHIEVSSVEPALPGTRLEIELPEGVELVSGKLNQVVDIPADGKVPVDLVIRVT